MINSWKEFRRLHNPPRHIPQKRFSPENSNLTAATRSMEFAV
ncbi:mCG1035350 [Mus musculus]|nr:mCG1035350 [Mus musculus]